MACARPVHAGIAAEAGVGGTRISPQAFAHGENLAGIQSSGGIERGADALHQRQIVRSEHQRHELVFLHADAMLAGERAAYLDAMAHDFSARRNDAGELLAIALVKQDKRMQVAVAGMKNVADLQIVFAADLLDAAQRFRQARARDDAVLHVIHRRKAAHGAKGVLSGLSTKGRAR